MFTHKSSPWGVQCFYWCIWFFFPDMCSLCFWVLRVCLFWRVWGARSLRRSDRLHLEHLSASFPRLQLACVHSFFSSVTSSCSSLCLSNTVLASWKEICDREEKPLGPPVAMGGVDGSWQGWLWLCFPAPHPASKFRDVPGTHRDGLSAWEKVLGAAHLGFFSNTAPATL